MLMPTKFDHTRSSAIFILCFVTYHHIVSVQ